MKLSILLLATLFSFSALALCDREAQFIGTVTNIKYYPAKKGKIEHHSYQIQLGHKESYLFNPSIICPMWEDELETATIKEPGFPMKRKGDFISGVLIFDHSLSYYRLE
jgi:hypothetical protein